MADAVRKVHLADFAPPSAIVNEKGDILYIHGHTGRYLEPSQGHPSVNLFEMAREGLQYELQRAIQSAVANKKDVIRRGLQIKSDEGLHTLNLIVKLLPDVQQGLLLVAFQDALLLRDHRSERGWNRLQQEKVDPVGRNLNGNFCTPETLQATIEEQ